MDNPLTGLPPLGGRRKSIVAVVLWPREYAPVRSESTTDGCRQQEFVSCAVPRRLSHQCRLDCGLLFLRQVLVSYDNTWKFAYATTHAAPELGQRSLKSWGMLLKCHQLQKILHTIFGSVVVAGYIVGSANYGMGQELRHGFWVFWGHGARRIRWVLCCGVGDICWASGLCRQGK